MHRFVISPRPGGLDIEVPADCAFVEGHFPGAPIVPGAALLQLVLAAARPGARQVASLPRVRFARPVRPGARLQLGLEDDGPRTRFTLREAGEVVAHGVIAFREADA